MILDARRIDRDQLRCDICIIGGGAAGIAAALELSGSGLDIVLLESGGTEFDPDTQALAGGENVSFFPFAMETTRLRFLGGTTNHWRGLSPRLEPSDMQPRAGWNPTGWPITHAELAAYYPRAEAWCELGGSHRMDVAALSRRIGAAPIPLAAGPLQASVGAYSPPTRFGEAYRARLEDAPGLRVLLNANVLELQATPDGTRVTGAEVSSLGGTPFLLRARVYVVACGGIESARLLLASRRGATAGLGNAHDLVGRHYMDHPGLAGGVLTMARSAPDMPQFLESHALDDSRVQGLLTAPPAVLEREAIGNFRVDLWNVDAPPDGPASARALLAIAADDQVKWQLGRHIANVLLDLDHLADAAWKSLVDRRGLGATATPRKPGRFVSAHISAEQLPNPDSRVTLSRETDSFGRPLARLDWRLQDQDFRTLRRGFELFAAAMGANGIGRVHLVRELSQTRFEPVVEIAGHHSGTTRMAHAPSGGVVDPNLRVHGIDNLHVASSSVFPSNGWANPTLTIVALTLRLTDHLHARFAAGAVP